MSTDEEYLDNLLKTMSTDDTEENNDNKIMSLMNETDPMENRTAPMRKEVFSDIRPEDEIPPADKKDDEGTDASDRICRDSTWMSVRGAGILFSDSCCSKITWN